MIQIIEISSRTSRRNYRGGMSLLELLACVSILSVLAAVIVPRLGDGASVARIKSCDVQREVIEVQAAIWKRKNANWPASDLSDMFADTEYFPEGSMLCPVDGTAYAIDRSTGHVVGHNH